MVQEAAENGPLAELFAQGVGNSGVTRVLQSIRKHLGMDVAFITHFGETDRVLENVDQVPEANLFPGQRVPLSAGYCLDVVRGTLPNVIPDTGAVPRAMLKPETTAIPIGSHLSVPIVLEDGLIYGTLCCFSFRPNLKLGDRDLGVMRVFAEVLASRITETKKAAQQLSEKAEAVRAAIRSGAPRMVFQPMYRLSSGKLTLMECLSRFNGGAPMTTDKWFSEAREVWLGLELEIAAIRKGLKALDELPASVSLAVNASPALAMNGALLALFGGIDASRVVLEITEHAIVADYESLVEALRPLRKLGARVAIDDAGAGYASMRHIVDLRPDLIKLDMSLTRNIDKDMHRRALARALISFAREIGSEISAEGVETEGELSMLQKLRVDQAQGFLLGRPMALDEALHLQLENAEARYPGRPQQLAHTAA